MNKFFLVSMVLALTLQGCARHAEGPDFKALNKQATKEYLEPVRPGYEGRNPYWNKYSKKFTYAPAFDFAIVEGAAKYRFDLAHADGQTWSFEADRPCEPLSKVWNDIPVGKVDLTVLGIAKDGSVVDTAGHRTFMRDFPFEGPYLEAAEDYRTCAIKAVLYTHRMDAVQRWLTQTEPDMSYQLNTYACKMIGSTVSNECLAAKLIPEIREDAILIARHAAGFLLSIAQPEGHPLAFFPPTYYKDLITSGKPHNKGRTMTLDALRVAHAYLDLYDLTGEQEWYDHAMDIAGTYVKIQREDGSFPVKVWYDTGEPVNGMPALLAPVIVFASRMASQYGVHDFDQMKAKAEQWMDKVALSTFNMSGQFEDVNIEKKAKYQNLANGVAASYACNILNRDRISDEDLLNARDLIRFAEDQFVHWGAVKDRFSNLLAWEWTPCVHEQYTCDVGIDSSARNLIDAWLTYYNVTGDELSYEKARAMANSLTNIQIHKTGQIPTFWSLSRVMDDSGYWINCAYASACILLKMADAADAHDQK